MNNIEFTLCHHVSKDIMIILTSVCYKHAVTCNKRPIVQLTSCHEQSHPCLNKCCFMVFNCQCSFKLPNHLQIKGHDLAELMSAPALIFCSFITVQDVIKINTEKNILH